MANLKNVIYLSNEDYETLVSTGTVTIDGVTLTYDENNIYITPDKLASQTEDGLMSASDKAKLDELSGYELVSSSSTSTGAITYVESISGGSASGTGSGSAAPNAHTHTYDTYSLSGSNASGTKKYMAFTPGTTPPSSASFSGTSVTSGNDSGNGTAVASTVHKHTVTVSGTTGDNSGSAVAAVTGYPNFSGGSGKLESYDAATGGTKKVSDGTRIPYVAAQGTITGASYTPAGSVSLTNGTAPSMGAATTKYLSAAPGNESKTTGNNSGSAVAAYTSVSTAGAIAGARSTSGSGTTARRILTITHTDPLFGTTNAAPHTHTHSYDKTTSVTLTANDSTDTGRITYVQAQGTFTAGTTPKASASFSGTAATITPTLSAATTYYLAHSHTGASLGTASTSNAAPHTHTHSYGSSTALTTSGPADASTSGDKSTTVATHTHTHSVTAAGSVSLTAGTAPSMNFNTGTTTDTPYISTMTDGSLSLTTNANAGTTSANNGSAVSTISGVSYTAPTATTKYLTLEEENN